MIKLTALAAQPLTQAGLKRLRKIVNTALETTGIAGRSASGQSLALAVDWCEERGVSYALRADPGLGYYLTTRMSIWRAWDLPNGEWEVVDWTPSKYETVVRDINQDQAKAIAEAHNRASLTVPLK